MANDGAEGISTRAKGERARYEQLEGQPGRSDFMFDEWLTSDSKVLAAMADNLASRYEHEYPRQRRMKTRDRDNMRSILLTILANLAYGVLKTAPHTFNPLTFAEMAAINAGPPSIGVSLRSAKQPLTRYDRKGFSGLPAMLEKLSRVGLFALKKSYQKGTASKIVIGDVLLQSAQVLGHLRANFAQAEGRETIYLSKVTKRDYVDGTVTRELVDYEDVPEADRYREEMTRIDAFLASADLRMEPDGGSPVITSMLHLRRHFNLPPDSDAQRFDLGGRLFGGWWQDLPRERRHAIRINGEPIADLDFSSMFLRLAYLAAGSAPPEGDLYASIHGLADLPRDGIKKLVSTMLFRTSPLTKVPRELKGEVPAGISGRRVRSAILAAHPTLASVFETGIGLSLMFTESQILVAALLRLIDRGIPALPMHDGLMAPRSNVGAAMEAMAAASEQVTDVRLPISLKF